MLKQFEIPTSWNIVYTCKHHFINYQKFLHLTESLAENNTRYQKYLIIIYKASFSADFIRMSYWLFRLIISLVICANINGYYLSFLVDYVICRISLWRIIIYRVNSLIRWNEIHTQITRTSSTSRKYHVLRKNGPPFTERDTLICKFFQFLNTKLPRNSNICYLHFFLCFMWCKNTVCWHSVLGYTK